jgi:hypothetical protein
LAINGSIVRVFEAQGHTKKQGGLHIYSHGACLCDIGPENTAAIMVQRNNSGDQVGEPVANICLDLRRPGRLDLRA